MSRTIPTRTHLRWAGALLVLAAVAVPLVTLATRSSAEAHAVGDTAILPPIKILEDSFSGTAATGDGADVWVAASYGVTEVDASTGKPVWLAEGNAYEFNQPSAITYDGEHLWIANSGGNSVTEIRASTGSLIRVLHGAPFALSAPSAIAYGDGDIWIANSVMNASVTEVAAATGALVRVVSDGVAYPAGAAYLHGDIWIASGVGDLLAEIDAANGALVRTTGATPSSLVVFQRQLVACGGNVWATDVHADAVDEFSATSGTLVRAVRFPSRDAILHFPVAIACDRGKVVVANVYARGRSRVGLATELDATTGAVVKVLNGAVYGFGLPNALVTDDAHLWVLGGNDALSEIDNATSALIRTVRGTYYGFSDPDALLDVGNDVWVAGGAGSTNTVSEVSATTDQPIRVVRGDASNGIDDPTALAYGDGHVWVANGAGDSVTELDAANGTLVRSIKGPCTTQCGGPSALVADAEDLWVEDLTYGQITEIDEATGSVVHVIPTPSGSPPGMTLGGGRLWIVDLAGSLNSDSISELALSSDRVVGVLVPGKVRLSDGASVDSVNSFGSVVYHRGYLWVLSSDEETGDYVVTEYDAATGTQVQILDGAKFGFNSPTAIGTDGRYIWIANGECVSGNCSTGTSITEVNASNGELIGVLSAPSFGFQDPSAFAYAGSDLWVANVGDVVTVFPVGSADVRSSRG